MNTNGRNKLDKSRALKKDETQKPINSEDSSESKCTTELTFLREVTGKANIQAGTQDSTFDGAELVQEENDKIETECEDTLIYDNSVDTNDHKQLRGGEKIEDLTVLSNDNSKFDSGGQDFKSQRETFNESTSYNENPSYEKKIIKNDEQRHDKRLAVSGNMNIGETINKRLGRAIIQSSENIIQIGTADNVDDVTEYVEKDLNVDDSHEDDFSTLNTHDNHSDRRGQSSHNIHSEMLSLSKNNHGFLNTELHLEDESETDIEHPDYKTVFSLSPKHDLIDCSGNISPNQSMGKQRSKNNNQVDSDEVEAGSVVEIKSDHLKHEPHAKNDSIHHKLDFFKKCKNKQSNSDNVETIRSNVVTDLYGNTIENPDFATKNWDSDSSNSNQITPIEENEVSPVSLMVAMTFDEFIIAILSLLRFLPRCHILLENKRSENKK